MLDITNITVSTEGIYYNFNTNLIVKHKLILILHNIFKN